MALSDITNRRSGDAIRVIGSYCVQMLHDTWIERDGVEVDGTRGTKIVNYWPGKLQKSDNTLVDTDLTGVDTDIANVCTGLWTDDVKESWRQHLIETQTTNESTKVSGLSDFYVD